MGFRGKGGVVRPYLFAGPAGSDRRTRRPSQLRPIHKVLRFSQAGHCYPPRLDRTNRELPHRSSLAASRDPWVPGSTEEPPGFLGKGVVMIHRPCLTAWSVGNPTPASVSIH
jgi:hypothetical protein